VSLLGRVTERAEKLSLRPRRSGDGFMMHCPAHDDRDPSFSVHQRGDKVLIHCHAGCDPQAIISSLGIEWSDLFEDGSPERQKQTIIAEYDYTDEAGNLLFQVCRFEGKSFRQRRPDGNGGWIWNLKGVRRVLFRLPKLLEAIGRGEPVFVVEGEKDVLRLEAAGVTATCNPAGAGKWREEQSEIFHGARVAIIPDNDDAGRKHAEEVASSIAKHAADVRVVELPGLPEGGDVSDWFANGGSVEQFKELLPRTRRWGEKSPKDDTTTPKKLSPLVFRPASQVEIRRQSFIYHPLVPLGVVSLVVGYPGIGKSTTACWIAAGITKGTLPGDLNAPARVVFLTGEDSWDTGIKPRLAAAGADMDLVGWVERPDGEDPEFPRDVAALEQFVGDHGVKLVVLDTVIDFADSQMTSDGSNLQVRRLLKPFKGLAERTGAGVLALTHPNKGSGSGIDRINASRAWGAAPRAVLVFGQDPEDENCSVVAVQKMSGAAKPPAQKFQIVPKMVGVDNLGEPIIAPGVSWLGEAPGVLADDLYSPQDDEERTQRDEAKVFLRQGDVMEAARPARDLTREAKDLGIDQRTLQRARRELQIPAWKDGFRGPWMWGPRPGEETGEDDSPKGDTTTPTNLSSSARPAETGRFEPKDDKMTGIGRSVTFDDSDPYRAAFEEIKAEAEQGQS
jgi:putative DNA primase/helicase